jgi:hypothetical protein
MHELTDVHDARWIWTKIVFSQTDYYAEQQKDEPDQHGPQQPKKSPTHSYQSDQCQYVQQLVVSPCFLQPICKTNTVKKVASTALPLCGRCPAVAQTDCLIVGTREENVQTAGMKHETSVCICHVSGGHRCTVHTRCIW